MTEIKLHNSATRRKEVFRPLDPDNVRMYVCGPTVYDRAHIGNARPAVVFDVLYRLLRHVYGEDHVTYVRNITDIDDKINARGPVDFPDLPPLEGISKVTEKTADWYRDDMAALGCLPPTHEPRATAFVPKMIEMIETLIARGFAYEAEGHVLFEVAKYEKYGALSGRSTDDMIAGARVEVAPYKRDPMDFVLWKPSGEDQPGWESPWSRGRPGWHIECSAMAKALLGETFDIHAGGADLQFPHHENEVAQSCCANGADFAKVWLHNGMIKVDGRKMSKSLGNFLTTEELHAHTPWEVLRYALLMRRYRDTLDWTEARVSEATTVLTQWGRLKRHLNNAERIDGWEREPIDEEFLKALYDDLNTHEAFERIRALACAARLDQDHGKSAKSFVGALDLLGFSLDNLDSRGIKKSIGKGFTETFGPLIDELLARRAEARNAKNFERADTIRKGLDNAGVEVMDRPGAESEWRLGPNFDPSKLESLK